MKLVAFLLILSVFLANIASPSASDLQNCQKTQSAETCNHAILP